VIAGVLVSVFDGDIEAVVLEVSAGVAVKPGVAVFVAVGVNVVVGFTVTVLDGETVDDKTIDGVLVAV
jgi:hypothetical protein